MYGVHPNTARNWKKAFLEKGPDIFAEDSVVAQSERRITELEQLVDKKEVEMALPRASWAPGHDTGAEGVFG